MTQRPFLTGLVAAFLIGSTAAVAQEIKNTSFGLPDGSRVLRHEGVVAAPLEDVWKTFTTADGLRTFLAPVVALDFRIGGKWEVSADPNGRLGDANNIVNEVLSFLPMEMISVRVVKTPSSFLHPDAAKGVWTIYQFERQTADRTRVIVSMVGWKSGADWDAVYEFFERGNAYTMGQLQQRFSDGPRRWH